MLPWVLLLVMAQSAIFLLPFYHQFANQEKVGGKVPRDFTSHGPFSANKWGVELRYFFLS